MEETEKKAPIVRLQGNSAGQPIPSLIHYQYLGEDVPEHLRKQGKVMVVDLRDETTVDKAFTYNFQNGQSGPVHVIPTVERSQEAGRVKISLKGSFSEGERKDEAKDGPTVSRVVFRAMVQSEIDVCANVTKIVDQVAGQSAGARVFVNEAHGRVVIIVEGSPPHVSQIFEELVARRIFSDIVVIQEGYPPYRALSGCAVVERERWSVLEGDFPQLTEWLTGNDRRAEIYNEFSSRSEHIRSLLFDNDLKTLSSVSMKKSQELERSMKESNQDRQQRIVSPVPNKPQPPRIDGAIGLPKTPNQHNHDHIGVTPIATPDSELNPDTASSSGLEKFAITGYFPYQHTNGRKDAESPPIRVRQQKGPTPPRKGSLVTTDSKEEASGRHLFASPPPRTLSPMPWAQPLPHAFPAGVAPVSLGGRQYSQTSIASSDNLADPNTFIQQFDMHIQHCIKNALASVKAQMEELAEAYRKSYISKLQARSKAYPPGNLPVATPHSPTSPPHSSFPFARTLSESRKLEQARMKRITSTKGNPSTE
mmetsp:Transcript_2960/g.5646  ORF Transcript_2960/g.5646 Transcript_2960/m.5646 type:complete len:535 (+) Transcript_2960:22-1626(+)